jgi:L-ascorbate metabolism protein UlaG (beta-lactamase superfamily)
LKALLKLLVFLGIVVVGGYYVVTAQPPFGARATGERLERIRKSPEFVAQGTNGGRFENKPPQDTDNSPIRNFQLYRQGFVREPRFAIPVMKLEPSKLERPANPGLRAYWFGHATALLEVDGVRVLTDPVLSEYASPYDVGPRRFHAPPVALSELTGIDAVVISHDHFDHLDMKTVQHLAGKGTHFYVGLGIGAHLDRWSVPAAQIHEMDWWEVQELKGVRIHCTPARHYSGRRWMDNSTLWASWMIRGPKHSAYYSGDTGYSPHFADIRRRVGAPELTLIKVGAYGDTWLDIHMDPEKAIQAHLDLGGQEMLPVHWATFDLSYHAWEEPIVRAAAAAASKGVRLLTPRIGEPVEAGGSFKNTEWYKEQSK